MTVEPRSPAPGSAQLQPAAHEPANLGDILERVLDRGIVIAGDIRVSLLDIELLTLKLRLVIASVDTARQVGIDWWEHDPWLSSKARPPVEAGSRDRRDQREIEAPRRPPVPARAERPERKERPDRPGRKQRKERDDDG